MTLLDSVTRGQVEIITRTMLEIVLELFPTAMTHPYNYYHIPNPVQNYFALFH